MSGKKFNFDNLIHLQAQFPDFIEVQVGKSQDGGYWVKILNLPGCFTQVEDSGELLAMVNDAIYTYFDIPEEYVRDMPRYFPTEEIRKKLQKWQKNIPVEFLQQPITFFQQGISLTPQ